MGIGSDIPDLRFWIYGVCALAVVGVVTTLSFFVWLMIWLISQ